MRRRHFLGVLGGAFDQPLTGVLAPEESRGLRVIPQRAAEGMGEGCGIVARRHAHVAHDVVAASLDARRGHGAEDGVGHV